MSGHQSSQISSQLERSSNMFSQLEVMMSAVKQESIALDAMKARIKELEDLQTQVPLLQQQLNNSERNHAETLRLKEESDNQANQLRLDMQRLNDLYNGERKQHLDCQHLQFQTEQKVIQLTKNVTQLQRDNDQYREQNQHLTKQLTTISQQLNEEKNNHKKTIVLMEQQNDSYEKMKVELSQHFWNITQELQQNKELNQQYELNMRELSDNYHHLHVIHQIQMENSLMKSEEIISIQAEEKNKLNETMATIHESYHLKLAQLESRIKELLQFEQDLKEKLFVYEQQETADEEIKVKLTTENKKYLQDLEEKEKIERILSDEIKKLIEKNERNESELKEMKESLEKCQESLRNKIEELDREGKRVKHELKERETFQTQYLFYEDQIKLLNEKNWILMQTNHEKTVENEELQEKNERIMRCSEEKEMKYQEMEMELRNEIKRLQEMINVLRDELEKRLEEYTKLRDENNEIKEKNKKILEEVSELKEQKKKTEKIFEFTIETERNKMISEVKLKLNRIKGLEKEKQEMLEETSELMRVIENYEKKKKEEEEKIFQLTTELNEVRMDKKELMEEKKKVLNEKNVLEQQLVMMSQEKKQLELQCHEDITRLDGLVKESRIAAIQQIQEMTSRHNELNEILLRERSERSESTRIEEEMCLQLKQKEVEIQLFKSQKEEMEQNFIKELTTLKRENQNLNTKIKALGDYKIKIEQEHINNKAELQQLRNFHESKMKEHEECTEKILKLESRYQDLQSEFETVSTRSKQNKVLVVEYEANCNRYKGQINKLQEEYAKLEKESCYEIKKLKLLNHQNNEQKEEIHENLMKLQEEYEMIERNYQTLQGTHNNTINELITELKNTEDILTKERVSCQKDVLGYQQLINELQNKNEEMKHFIKEKMYETENNKNSFENAAMKYSNEINRMKLLNENLEKRNVELEKTHSENRNKYLEVKNQLMRMEQEMIQQKSEIHQLEKIRKSNEGQIQKYKRQMEEMMMLNDEEGRDGRERERERDRERDRDREREREGRTTKEMRTKKSYYDADIEDLKDEESHTDEGAYGAYGGGGGGGMDEHHNGSFSDHRHQQQQHQQHTFETMKHESDDHEDWMSSHTHLSSNPQTQKQNKIRSGIDENNLNKERKPLTRDQFEKSDHPSETGEPTPSNSLDDINEAIARTQRFLSNRGGGGGGGAGGGGGGGAKVIQSSSQPQRQQQSQHQQQQHSQQSQPPKQPSSSLRNLKSYETKFSSESMDSNLPPNQTSRRSFNDEDEDYHSLQLSSTSLLPATPPPPLTSISNFHEDDNDYEGGEDYDYLHDGATSASYEDHNSLREKSYSAPTLSGNENHLSSSANTATTTHDHGIRKNKSNRKVKSSSNKTRTNQNYENEMEIPSLSKDKDPSSGGSGGGLFPKITQSRKPVGR